MSSRKRSSEGKQQQNKRIKTEVNTDEARSLAAEEINHSEFMGDTFFSDKNIFILPAGIEKMRLTIFKNQITRFGGKFFDKFDASVQDIVSFIVVDDNMNTARMCNILHLGTCPTIPVVKSTWLSTCLRDRKLLPMEPYLLNNETVKIDSSEKQTACIDERALSEYSQALAVTTKNKCTVVNHDFSSSEEENEREWSSKSTYVSLITSQVKPEKWLCAQSSKNPKVNLNKNITDTLEEMSKMYESTNDKWRAFGYQKAIKGLRNYPKPITSWEEAKSLPGIGRRLADKIWEIAQSGELRKLKEFESCEMTRVLQLFTNVWGAGPQTAMAWYQQGLRNIEDLKTKANLTSQQKVGVRLYGDLLDRMPREEAGEIEQVVKQAAESIQEGIIAQACGSYRRGKATCGDVDVLITHPDGKSHKGIFLKLISKLKESGFLTDDLVSVEESGNQKKYLGVCKLQDPNRKHRRLDIIVVPYREYGCALVYFTGSAHFNRSLRHLCKTQNMSLNEHALKIGVVRKGKEKIYEGTVVPTPTEESVFEALNIPYRTPEERDH
ncbi:hypothetical protein Btru_042723 [Bulinus truncatus]|nr:hypothetical protein Btru_042723 [Bulinus truncatus]